MTKTKRGHEGAAKLLQPTGLVFCHAQHHGCKDNFQVVIISFLIYWCLHLTSVNHIKPVTLHCFVKPVVQCM